MTKHFIGTKIVLALAMTRLAYNEYRGWPLPSDENGADDGYLVEYTDGGKPNHPDHPGYISWSPKEQFDNAYRAASGMSFGLAVEALKRGGQVARAGWNGKGMWLKLVPADLAETVSFQHEALRPLPWIGMKTADQCFVPWLASRSDILADDWQLVG